MSQRLERSTTATPVDLPHNRPGTPGGPSPPDGGSRLCDRCDGYMIEDIIEAFDEEQTIELIWAWRCVNCGELIDPLIMAHRTPDP